jgi:hypothetical protein
VKQFTIGSEKSRAQIQTVTGEQEGDKEARATQYRKQLERIGFNVRADCQPRECLNQSSHLRSPSPNPKQTMPVIHFRRMSLE